MEFFSKAGDEDCSNGNGAVVSTLRAGALLLLVFDCGSFITLGEELEEATGGGGGKRRGEILIARGEGDSGESPRKPIAARLDLILSTAF